MKRISMLGFFFFYCTSGSDQSMRNADIFAEAGQISFPAFTTVATTISGNIGTVITEIQTTPLNTAIDTAAPSCGTSCSIIEGIVTIPSDYAIAIADPTATEANSGCTGNDSVTANNTKADKIFARSFILQDSTAAILIAYGQEPPSQDVNDASSMKYIVNSRRSNMATFGDRMRITIKRVQYYGAAIGTAIPIITDFSNPVVISSRNSVPYTSQAVAFARGVDLYRARRLEGYISAKPAYKSCDSGKVREFQFNYQTGYMGKICVGTVSNCNLSGCTCTGTEYNFQMSYSLGAGTLSGFDTDNSFSYNFAPAAKVRLTGPIFPPQYNAADTNLSLMLSQRIQAETIK